VSNYSEQFLKTNPLAVLGVIRDLQKQDVPVRISWGNNQFISKILDATPERLVMDFRINAPLHPAYFCKAKMPDKSVIRFRLHDLSLGGMGALMDSAKPEALVEGMRFSQIELDMGGWGRFFFDAQLITVSERKVVDSKNETITTPRLSFRFLNVGPGPERELQRIIYSLEREARERANKVR